MVEHHKLAPGDPLLSGSAKRVEQTRSRAPNVICVGLKGSHADHMLASDHAETTAQARRRCRSDADAGARS